MTFKNYRLTHYNWSSYSCFAEYIKNKKIPKNKLKKMFFENVDRSDYLKSEQEMILEDLYELSHGIER